MFSYLLCHLVGVTSTVTNPILYAMLNYNFKKEFQIFAGKIPRIFLCFSSPPNDELIELSNNITWRMKLLKSSI